MTDLTIEQEIQAKGLTAPRVTPADIAANIASECYFTASDGRRGAIEAGEYFGREAPQEGDADLIPLNLLTFCILVLRNGYTVTGESACASPENFNAEIGRKIARENAVQKVWPLMGYQLKERVYQNAQPDPMADVASYLHQAHAAALDPSPDEPGKAAKLLDQAIAALEHAK